MSTTNNGIPAIPISGQKGLFRTPIRIPFVPPPIGYVANNRIPRCYVIGKEEFPKQIVILTRLRKELIECKRCIPTGLWYHYKFCYDVGVDHLIQCTSLLTDDQIDVLHGELTCFK